ncbi:hypothetical protein VPH35_005388 [Triticum aestivum]
MSGPNPAAWAYSVASGARTEKTKHTRAPLSFVSPTPTPIPNPSPAPESSSSARPPFSLPPSLTTIHLSRSTGVPGRPGDWRARGRRPSATGEKARRLRCRGSLPRRTGLGAEAGGGRRRSPWTGYIVILK